MEQEPRVEHEPLAHWTYSMNEWNTYVAASWRNCIFSAVRSFSMFIAIAVFTGWLARSWVAGVIAAFLLLWVPALELGGAVSSRKRMAGSPEESIIAGDRLCYTHFVLGRREVALTGRRVLEIGVAKGAGGLTFLKIVHRSTARRSASIPEMIPVPGSALEEAKTVAEELRNLYPQPRKRFFEAR